MSELTLMISSGMGPKECVYAAKGIRRAFARESKAAGLKYLMLETEQDRSCLLRLSGDRVQDFARDRLGTVQWIGQSPYRPRHKRKNWFVNVSILSEPENIATIVPKDVVFTAMRASGPGGQHVNKTNSAVRAVHPPTGLMVSAQEERSQHANKKLCLIKLAAIMRDRKTKSEADQNRDNWQTHKSLERGNAVRVYEGEKFRLR